MAFRLDEAGIALLKVGNETPGVLLRVDEELGQPAAVLAGVAACGWRCGTRGCTAGRWPRPGIQPLDDPFPVATGWTVEIADPWGNVIGFTDYGKRPELARAT